MVLLAIEARNPAVYQLDRFLIWRRIRNINGASIVAYESFVWHVLASYIPVANPANWTLGKPDTTDIRTWILRDTA